MEENCPSGPMTGVANDSLVYFIEDTSSFTTKKVPQYCVVFGVLKFRITN